MRDFWTPARVSFLMLLGVAFLLLLSYLDMPPIDTAFQQAKSLPLHPKPTARDPSDPDQFCSLLEEAVERAKLKLPDADLKRDLAMLAEVCAGVVAPTPDMDHLGKTD
jgi:hypothetical protein